MRPIARILVVDNDSQTCRDLHDLLNPQGYDVYAVTGDEANIVAQARDVARQKRPHVVVVDLRLQDDYMDEYSGLDILHSIESAHTILYSAYLTSDALREVRDLLFDWIRKHDAAAVLRSCVRRAAVEKSVGVSGTEVDWPSAIDSNELAVAIADPILPPPPPLLLDDVVLQLCPNARRVHLQPLRRTQSAPSGASRTRSAVLMLQRDDWQPAVLKFARSQQIRAEQANYEQYIKQRLPGPYSAHQINATKFWDIGGVTYTFMGTGVEALPTFSDFYHRTEDPAAILAPLRFFFQEVWGTYYRATKPLAARSLFEAYDQLFELRGHEVELGEFYYRMLHAGALPVEYHNPLAWLIRNAEKSRLSNLRQTITHGDLHGDNLFVDGEHAWVIDFERTGPGHILRDFVELEVDILVRLLSWNAIDDAGFRALVSHLSDALESGQGDQMNRLGAGRSEVLKAYSVILGLRKIAYAITDFEPVEYWWSVLTDALFTASITGSPLQQRERAMALGALISERLQNRL